MTSDHDAQPSPASSSFEPAHAPQKADGEKSRLGRSMVQLVGFVIGIGLLTWCATIAFSEKNRSQLARLQDARWTDVALLIGLSFATMLVNTTAFWSMINAVRRVPFRHVFSVSCVASALAYLPFKLSLVFRAAAHHRIDGVPLLTVGTWLGNMGVIMLAVIGPALAASAWRPQVDEMWWATAAGGAALITLTIFIAARLFSRDGLWRVVEQRVMGASPNPRGWRGVARRMQFFPRAHEGVRMLAHPSASLGGAALRAMDIGIQSARFVVAARIVGVELSFDQAIAAAATYFIIGALSPTGMLGFREAGVFALLQSQSFAVVVLTVTAIEMVVNLVAAIPAALVVRHSRRHIQSSSEQARGTPLPSV